MSAETNRDRPQLKICGITTIADLRLVAQIEADFFGTIVDIPRSPRSIGADRAAALGRTAAAYSEALRQVLVVEEPGAGELAELSESLSPFAFQIHADEANATNIEPLRAAIPGGIELWMAVGIPPGDYGDDVPVGDISRRIERLSEAGIERIVLDTRTESGTGGTGRTSNWEAAGEIIEGSEIPVMLAGGISPDNIAEAVSTARPTGIDVSSGVEKTPGRKYPFALQLLAARFEKTTQG